LLNHDAFIAGLLNLSATLLGGVFVVVGAVELSREALRRFGARRMDSSGSAIGAGIVAYSCGGCGGVIGNDGSGGENDTE
jgi:hypothetical protein